MVGLELVDRARLVERVGQLARPLRETVDDVIRLVLGL
jgi:hypothetical protein